ncbi:MAG TPA: DUF2207 domain-containing protein, partial [Bacteroidales bacterium]|nr:DUF2207 domain-containing protein [Bacteroidales bacterium]
MKKIFTIIVLTLLSYSGFSEAFDITNYFVDMQMNANGSILVTETIQVHFTEERHGIIRSMPFRYRQVDFPNRQRAERASLTADYELLIKDVAVDGFEFSTSIEGDFLKIKIGSADKYINGNQTFVIKYLVWGALNKFSDRTEFYWNLIGHQWDCDIAAAGFRIVLPKTLNLTNNDVLLFTGAEGSKNTAASYTVSPNEIKGALTSPLKANEGMTVAVKFPNSAFTGTSIPIENLATNFYIDKLLTKININYDGSLTVEEKYSVVLMSPQASFIRDFYTLRTNDSSTIKDHVLKEIKVNYISRGVNNAKFVSQNEGENKYISLYSETEKFSDKLEVTYRYTVWGAVTFKNGIAEINWPLNGEMAGEPFKGFTAEISADPEINIEKTVFRYYKLNKDHPISPEITFDKNKKTYVVNYSNVFSTDPIFLTQIISDEGFNKNLLPFEIYAKKHYIKDFLTQIQINKNGSLHVSHQYLVKFKNPYSTENSFTANENFSYYDKSNDNKAYGTKLPDWSFLSGYNRLIIKNLSASGIQDEYSLSNNLYNSVYWGNTAGTAQDTLYTYEYDVFGLFTRKNGRYYLNKSLTSPFSEPIKTGTIQITLPENVHAADISTLFLVNNIESDKINFTVKDNTITCKLSKPLFQGEVLFLDMSVPRDKLSVSCLLTWKIIWKNNKLLILPFIIFLLLFILWYVFGRDK